MREPSQDSEPSEMPEPAPCGTPPWSGALAAQDTVVGVLRLGAIIGRTDATAIGIARICVYRAGFGVALFIVRSDENDSDRVLNHGRASGPLSPTAETSVTLPQTLSFGVEFADGSAANNERVPADLPHERNPEVIVCEVGDEAAGLRRTVWIRPLPPAGPLTFRCDWPALGIAAIRLTIDAQSILDVVN
jgi:hypothetical protein